MSRPRSLQPRVERLEAPRSYTDDELGRLTNDELEAAWLQFSPAERARLEAMSEEELEAAYWASRNDL
jgi:hypothetical protein